MSGCQEHFQARIERLSDYPGNYGTKAKSDHENACDKSLGFYVSRLTLTDFRCYQQQRVETDSQLVVLTGANGSGKTNLLEALSFLAPGRGLRNACLNEAARRDFKLGDDAGSGRSWAVAARVLTPMGEINIGTGREHAAINGPERRAVHVDGNRLAGQAALAGLLAVNWLTPQMDRLLAGEAASRRRFVDRLVYGGDASHAGRVNAYAHALRERAKLLRQAGGHGDQRWLSALEDKMAETGVAIVAARLETVARLDAIAANDGGPFPGAALELKGEVESWLDQGPALEAESRLRLALAKSRPMDASAGGASAGPHLSDLKVRHLTKGCSAESCSTGEQKALLIAIILANANLQKKERGAAPILLLDEAAAHLDGQRRESLFAAISELGSQVWLTGAEASLFLGLRGKASFFNAADGKVTPA